MAKPTDFRPIYARFLKACTPYSLPEPWESLGAPLDCWRLPLDARNPLYTALFQEFGVDTVSAAGFKKRAPAKRVSSDPPQKKGRPLIALRRHPDDAPFELLTTGGALAGVTWPVRAALEDAWSRERLARDDRLFAVFDSREVAVLRGLGFAATLADGLEQPDWQQLVDLSDQFGTGHTAAAPTAPGSTLVEPPGEERPVCNDTATDGLSHDVAGFVDELVRPPAKHVLVLVDWSPATLTIPLTRSPKIEIIDSTRALRQASSAMQLDFSRIRVWRPCRTNLEKLQYLAHAGAPPDTIQRTIRASLDADSYRFPTAAEPTPLGYSEAWEHYREMLVLRANGKGDAEELDRAHSNFRDAVERELIAPLQREALQESDPLRRAAGLELAQTTRLLQELAPQLDAALVS